MGKVRNGDLAMTDLVHRLVRGATLESLCMVQGSDLEACTAAVQGAMGVW